MTAKAIPSALRQAVLFFLAVLLPGTALAVPQQVGLNGQTGSFTFPSSAPYSTISSWRLEIRFTVTNTTPPSAVNLWNIGGFSGYWLRLNTNPGPILQMNDYADPNGCQFSVPITFNQDTVARLTKDAVAGTITLESWNITGTNYHFQTGNCAPPFIAGALTGSGQIGASESIGTVAFVRLYSSIVPLNSASPTGSSGGDLADWEFNGNGRDSSGHGSNISFSPGVSYSSAAVYPPACVMPPQQTFRAGAAATLTSSSFALDGGNSLTYAWNQVSGPVPAQIVSAGSGGGGNQITLGGMIFGSYTFQQTVTDSHGQSTTCSGKYGAVPTDANGSVIISNPVHAAILGPMIASFANPWPAYETQGNAFANLIIEKLAGTAPYAPQFPGSWDVAQPGTITVFSGTVTTSGNVVTWVSGTHFTDGGGLQSGNTIFVNGNQCTISGVSSTSITCTSSLPTYSRPVWYGSSMIVGSGTSFTALFGGGTTTPISNGTQIVVWYPILNSPYPAGVTGRRSGQVTAIIDDTHLTASFATFANGAWISDAYSNGYVGAGSGLGYAYMENSLTTGPYGTGAWGSGGSAYPANYYDNVMALYARYYATGIDDYLTAARTLADRWWSYPVGDKGLAYELTTGSDWANYTWAPRQMALAGLWLRNADNPPYDYTPGLRLITTEMIGPEFNPNVCSRLGPVPTGSWPNQYNLYGGAEPVCGFDIRESGYLMAGVAYDALFDANAAQVAASKQALSNEMQYVFSAVHQPAGEFLEDEPSVSSSQTGFTASVIVGSPYATAASGNVWPLGYFNNTPPYSASNLTPAIWFNKGGTSYVNPQYQNPACAGGLCPGTVGDTNWYYAVIPQGTITSISTTNPMVVSFASTPSWLTPSSTVQFTGISGCTVNGGTGYTVAAVSGTTATINVSGVGCTASSARIYDAVRVQLSDINGNPVTYIADNSCANSCSGLGWEVGGVLGEGSQPYQVGIESRGFYFTSLALRGYDDVSANAAQAFILSNANWTSSTGLNSTNKGLYYGRVFPTCEPPAAAYPGCDSGLIGDRDLNGEGMNTANMAFLLYPGSATAKTLGDLLMSAMFSVAGDGSSPGFDGTNILGDLSPGGYMYASNSSHKWFGYYWGASAPWSWPSIRLGGLMPPVPRVIDVSLNFQSSAQALLTVTRPDGTSSQVTCTSSPCPVTIDSRQGDHLLSIKYLDTSNHQLRAAQMTVIKGH